MDWYNCSTLAIDAAKLQLGSYVLMLKSACATQGKLMTEEALKEFHTETHPTQSKSSSIRVAIFSIYLGPTHKDILCLAIKNLPLALSDRRVGRCGASIRLSILISAILAF